MKGRSGPLVFMLAALAAAACGGVDDPVLARVEGSPVTWSEYRREYVDYLAETGLPDEPARRRSFLERLVSMRLVALEGRDGGLDQTGEYERFLETARRRLLVDAYLADAVFDTLTVSRSELESLFARVNTKVTARHLYAGSLEEAERLEARLSSGERFEDLAREVFADPALAESGGMLGTFGFDEMDPAFEETAFSLPVGEVSEPVRTARGWSIVRVDDRFMQPILTESEFVSRLGHLESYALARRRESARRALARTLEAELAPRLEPSAGTLLARITGDAGAEVGGDAGAGVGGDAGTGMGEIAEAGVRDDSPLVRFVVQGRERAWTVAEFRDAARYTSDRQKGSVRDEATLEAFVNGLLVRDEMMRRATERGLQRTARYRTALEAAVREWMYEHAYERLVRSLAVAQDSVVAWFEAHREEFVVPERVHLREIVVATRRAADSLRALDAPFDELARRHSLRAESAGLGGALGWLSRDELGPWADAAFRARPGEVVGPYEVRGRYLLLQVGERRAGRPATLQEVRGDIESMLRRERQTVFLREHVASLRGRYEVRYTDTRPEDLPLESQPIRSS